MKSLLLISLLCAPVLAQEAQAPEAPPEQPEVVADPSELLPLQAQDQESVQEDALADDDIEGEEVHETGEEHEHNAPGAHHEEGHEEGFDLGQFVATVVNFLILLAILFFLLRKPTMEFLRTRRLQIEEGLVESKRLKDEAERKYDEYSKRLEQMDAELERMRKEMVQAGEAERDRIIAEAEARAARMRKDAQFVIDQRLKQMRADLTKEAIEAAVNAAEKLLSDGTTAQDQEKLADAYLGHLEGSMRGDGEAQA